MEYNNYNIKSTDFLTNSNFIKPITSYPDNVNLWYLKLLKAVRLNSQIGNINGLH